MQQEAVRRSKATADVPGVLSSHVPFAYPLRHNGTRRDGTWDILAEMSSRNIFWFQPHGALALKGHRTMIVTEGTKHSERHFVLPLPL